jgi:hypothetical protein
MAIAIIESVGTDRCLIKGGEVTEGVRVKFEDGSVSGFLSWPALRKLVTARAQAVKPDAPVIEGQQHQG